MEDDNHNRKFRWYEFKIANRDDSFFFQAAVGDDLISIINEQIGKITSSDEGDDHIHAVVYLGEASDCRACRENQPGQLAHSEFGGCLYTQSQSSNNSNSVPPNKRNRSSSSQSDLPKSPPESQPLSLEAYL